MTGLAKQAEVIAQQAHQGQVDKAGRPYAEHPARVAARVGPDELTIAAAWLHDVVEDTPITLDDLAQAFPPEVIAAVDALTKRAGEAPDIYYQRVGANEIARRVKQADLDDNSDPTRLAMLDEATRTRLEAKYAAGRAKLASGATDVT